MKIIALALFLTVSIARAQTHAGGAVATLDPAEPLMSGTSLFWCPTGQAAWDQLRAYHGVKAIEFEKRVPVAEVLNTFAWDAAKTLPDDSIVFGGDDSEAFRERIRAELRKRVGKNAADMIGPYLPPGRVNETTVRLQSALMVSCLSHSPRFPASFRPTSAAFHLASGHKPVVEGFGASGNETAAHFDVVEVLADDLQGSFILKLTFFTGEKARPEFMLIGMRPQMGDLASGIEWMREALKKPLPVDQAVQHQNAWWRYHNQLTPSDRFWMPKLKTTLSCEYGELIGQKYLRTQISPGLSTWWQIREAQQLLVFRLNEQGALAQSVFKVSADFLTQSGAGAGVPKPKDVKSLPFLPRRFLFDRPFMATLWMKGAEWPYLACWVDSESVLVQK